MSKRKRKEKATSRYSVTVKTAPENMEAVEMLMDAFEKRFRHEFKGIGSVTVMRELSPEDL